MILFVRLKMPKKIFYDIYNIFVIKNCYSKLMKMKVKNVKNYFDSDDSSYFAFLSSLICSNRVFFGFGTRLN